MAFKLGKEKREFKTPDSTPIFRKKLEGNTLGEANMDGSINISKNIPVNSALYKRTIKHEQEHINQMKSGKASYTDNTVTWKGKKYKRKDGYIYGPNGKLEEGHKDHPWEKEAIKAETK